MHQDLDSLDIVKQAFIEWREQRPRKCAIPSYLWDMVKPLLDKYPKSMISRVLGISSSQIKNNILDHPVTFVEAISSNTSEAYVKASVGKQSNLEIEEVKPQEQCCHIEVKRPCGSVLKINALPISVVSSLILSFVDV